MDFCGCVARLRHKSSPDQKDEPGRRGCHVARNADKNIILKGPWPFAHNVFMETKEHLVIMLLLLVTYLPIAASNNLAANREARQVVLWVSAMIALLALLMEGDGAMVAMGVKVALLPK